MRIKRERLDEAEQEYEEEHRTFTVFSKRLEQNYPLTRRGAHIIFFALHARASLNSSLCGMLRESLFRVGVFFFPSLHFQNGAQEEAF